MSHAHSLNEDDIRNWAGEASFLRGQDYYRAGYIHNARRREPGTLLADCEGSGGNVYGPTVTLSAGSITAADCDCPVGEGGHCKHVAALLLTWLHAPDTFSRAESLSMKLQSLDRDHLIALIDDIAAHFSDVRGWLDLRLAADRADDHGFDHTAFKREVDLALGGEADGRWYSSRPTRANLAKLTAIAQRLRESGRVYAAAQAYGLIASGIIDTYYRFEDGGPIDVAVDCAERMGECLSGITAPEQRYAILLELYELIAWDVEHGGTGLDDTACDVVLERAQPEERRRLVLRLGDLLSTTQQEDPDSTYSQFAIGAALLRLQADTLGDEEVLALCRAAGLSPRLIERLLSLGRVAEAVQELQNAREFDLLSLVQLFVDHGHGELAETLAREYAATHGDRHNQIQSWLRDRALDREDWEGALALTQARFFDYYSGNEYDRLCQLATRLGRWDEVREQVLAQLAEAQDDHTIAEIHLANGDIAAALQAYERIGPRDWRHGNWRSDWRDESLAGRLARAAETDYPQEAIRLHCEVADGLIKTRNTGAYGPAVQHLLRVRDLCRRLGQEEIWQQLLAQVRADTNRLRAFKAEMASEGL